MIGKGGLTASLLFIALTAHASVTTTNAFASDTGGNQVQPNLGETFYVTVRLASDVPGNDPYTLQFSAPSGNRQTPTFATVGGSGQVTWGPFICLMDAPMAIDIRQLETGNTTHLVITPTEPTSAVETYAQTQNTASMSANWTGIASTTKWWLPVPPTGPFQQMSLIDEPGTQTLAATTGQFVSVVSGIPSVSATYSFTASSVRSNAGMLRTQTYVSVSAAKTSMKPWLTSETYLEVSNSSITSFVTGALGKGYQSRLTPYDAAEKLYLSTIKKLSYTSTAYAPSALQALRRGNGDCGSFSSLFVAACRNAGIPARPACGFVQGSNQWHVWAECWLPNVGWIPVDPTYADNLRPQGDLPLYFGVVPDLNKRLVTAYGFSRQIGSTKVSMLQSPALFYTGLKVKGTVNATCSLD